MTLEGLARWRYRLNCRIVATNGCFDILHAGHVRFLAEAACYADALLVGVNDDAGVRTLKGDGRPVNCQDDRAEVLAALQSVYGVIIFGGTSAVDFLQTARPHIWVKGGDYTEKTLCPREVATVRRLGGNIKILTMHDGYSTTSTIGRAAA